MMYLRAMWLMVKKDLTVEFRTKTLLISAVTFAALLVILLGFSLPSSVSLAMHDIPGMLWVLIFIAGYMGLNRQDDKERYDGAMYGALLIPVDRSAILYARIVSNTLFLLLIEIIIIPLFVLILHQSLPRDIVPLCLAIILATMGFMAMGTFLTSVASASNLREIVVPILLFPLAIPLFLAVQTITQAAWFNSGLSLMTAWWAVLVGYMALFLILPGLLFEILVEV